MLTHHHGTTTLEYIVVGALIIAVTAVALIALFDTISTKLQEINVAIGS